MSNYGSMSMGGRTIHIPNNTGSAPNPFGGMPDMAYSDESIRRMQREEEERRRRERQNSVGAILNSMFGGAREAAQISPNRGFPDGPNVNEFAPLNYSYKTRGNAPRYHEEMPMGGTPGVYAIRNDELWGPVGDRSRMRGGERRSRGPFRRSWRR
jgi:hypothetical protein